MSTRPTRVDHLEPGGSSAGSGLGSSRPRHARHTPHQGERHATTPTASPMAWPDDLEPALVEHAFETLLGRPGQRPTEGWQADVFREGVVARLGALVTGIAADLDGRVAASASFAVREAVARAAERLLEIGDLMRAQPEDAREPFDYHWIIIGELVAAVAALTEPPDDHFTDAGDALEW